jgi:hypothetical protein
MVGKEKINQSTTEKDVPEVVTIQAMIKQIIVEKSWIKLV